MEPTTIALIGALDTKGSEYAYVQQLIEARGFSTLVIDTSVVDEPRGVVPDVAAGEVAEAAGETLESLRAKGDRGWAMTRMAEGASRLVRDLWEDGAFAGILGMGGTGGTSVISAAMRTLKVGVPKVLVSTAASGDTRPFLGFRDIVLIPSVVDVAGLNRISKRVFREAAGAICGMIEIDADDADDAAPVIAVTMFGNTTACTDACRAQLTADGYEVLVFHCTGTGGQAMEALVADGLVRGVLDITTTECADELCGGVFSAGPTRLTAPGKAGVPHVIVPGCLDMVNFGPVETVPEIYRDRSLHVWNPSVTLMRTTPEENAELGRTFALRANAATGPVAFLLPLRGVSLLDSEGNEFWWPEADAAFRDALRSHLRPDIRVEESEANINDKEFSDHAVALLVDIMRADA